MKITRRFISSILGLVALVAFSSLIPSSASAGVSNPPQPREYCDSPPPDFNTAYTATIDIPKLLRQGFQASGAEKTVNFSNEASLRSYMNTYYQGYYPP